MRDALFVGNLIDAANCLISTSSLHPPHSHESIMGEQKKSQPYRSAVNDAIGLLHEAREVCQGYILHLTAQGDDRLGRGERDVEGEAEMMKSLLHRIDAMLQSDFVKKS